MICRSPHGERGLKFDGVDGGNGPEMSLPAWGAWIEIHVSVCVIKKGTSLPAWGAWIEIFFACLYCIKLLVAPRMGSVD